MRRVAVVLLAAACLVGCRQEDTTEWQPAELSLLRSLTLAEVEPVRDPSNRFAARRDAARFGRSVFFDKRFSSNGKVSCASCHVPKRNFQDGRKVGKGIGLTTRRTMSLVAAAHQQWLFWDGRKDSLWSQALAPLVNPLEHGLTRGEVVALVRRHHRAAYESVFGAMAGQRANRIFANVGKAIAAFEARLELRPARFDRYVAAAERGDREEMRAAMSAQEVEGLKLFLGEAGCVDCHSGPFFTNGEFHNTGIPQTVVDAGRLVGVAKLREDPFNCVGQFSDAKPEDCEVLFLPRASERLRGAFKPPSLRNVTRNAPYMHAGQFARLGQVLRHYNRAPRAQLGRSELRPLRLGDGQLRALAAFLSALESPARSP